MKTLMMLLAVLSGCKSELGRCTDRCEAARETCFTQCEPTCASRGGGHERIASCVVSCKGGCWGISADCIDGCRTSQAH